MRDGEFRNPRLVSVYDASYGWSREDDFFVGVVGPVPARVLDLGCGTGRLAAGLAGLGHVVTGVDPARASVEAARRRGADVTWVEGTAADVTGPFDAALMTSHVSQVFDPDGWRDVLGRLADALAPGGVLAFDTRDPAARRWERWNPEDSRRAVVVGGEVVVVWLEVVDLSWPSITFTQHYEFPGEKLASTSTLWFRDQDEVRDSLVERGFTVEQVYGGWSREPVGHGAGELIVIART
ncbi:class I SAM-dependent methyltransferase [Actinosynnema sp. NPDC020468]|uniref:class I SAM-dependent methyltransferase n=1 Tax=Actinosynnema sp. NPDC020468 TaxID=3154488 RepID=UPI0033C49754